jgi:hypothetical protein
VFHLVFPVLACSFLPQVAESPARGASAAEITSWPLWLAEAPAAFPEGAVGNPWQASLTRPSPGSLSEDRPSVYWTRASLELIAKYQVNPLRASRVLSLLHASMHDALVRGVRSGQEERIAWVAVHRAASLILADLFPYESPERFEAQGLVAAAAAAESDPDRALLLWAIGREVAEDASARARSDGSDRVWNLENRPAQAPGRWRPTPPIHSFNPLEPLAGEWRPWVLAHGGAVEPPEPVPYDSPAFWKEVEEVREVARSLTPAEKAIAEAWNLDRGTVTPAGVWNLKAADLVRDEKLSPSETVRLFAALNVAMTDAFIACWHAKYKWWTIRPVSVIRDRYDPDFLSYLITPSFPSYVSGHASASGAAEAVLARFFPERAGWLRAQAEEAALSRLFGGIHYRSDNDAGLELGREVGRKVLQRIFGPASP